jgi:hypothetical protein
MVRNNEKNKPINSEGDSERLNNEHQNSESQKFSEWKKETIRNTRKLEESLANELEHIAAEKNLQTIPEYIRQNDSQANVPHDDLENIFRDIDTWSVQYPFLRGIFPELLRVCEESWWGQNIGRDILGLGLGLAESAARTVQLWAHILIDLGRCVVSLRSEWKNTALLIHDHSDERVL